jgi:lysophospholipase L1-like esterase
VNREKTIFSHKKRKKIIMHILILLVFISGYIFLFFNPRYIHRALYLSDIDSGTPNYANVLYSWERSLKNTHSDIVFFGDSITSGGKWDEYYPSLNVCNLGIGGDNIEGLTRRVKLVQALSPKKVFVMIGVNNTVQLNWKSGMPEKYEALFDKLEQLDAEVYIQSILPVRSPSSIHNNRIVEMNRYIKESAERHNFTYIDLHSVMKDENGELIKEYSRDGVHLTEQGYTAWTRALEPYIQIA